MALRPVRRARWSARRSRAAAQRGCRRTPTNAASSPRVSCALVGMYARGSALSSSDHPWPRGRAPGSSCRAVVKASTAAACSPFSSSIVLPFIHVRPSGSHRQRGFSSWDHAPGSLPALNRRQFAQRETGLSGDEAIARLYAARPQRPASARASVSRSAATCASRWPVLPPGRPGSSWPPPPSGRLRRPRPAPELTRHLTPIEAHDGVRIRRGAAVRQSGFRRGRTLRWPSSAAPNSRRAPLVSPTRSAPLLAKDEVAIRPEPPMAFRER